MTEESIASKKTLPDVNIEEYSKEFLMKIWQKGDERSLIGVGTPDKIDVTKTVFLNELVDIANEKQ